MMYKYFYCLTSYFYLVKGKFNVAELGRNYILSNSCLYSRILTYEPILLEEILLPLKYISSKVTKIAIMDFLDNQVGINNKMCKYSFLRN